MPPEQNPLQWEKQLEDFEMVLEDGCLKDCLVYHEATKPFIAELLTSSKAQWLAEKREQVEAMDDDRILENPAWFTPYFAGFDEAKARFLALFQEETN